MNKAFEKLYEVHPELMEKNAGSFYGIPVPSTEDDTDSSGDTNTSSGTPQAAPVPAPPVPPPSEPRTTAIHPTTPTTTPPASAPVQAPRVRKNTATAPIHEITPPEKRFQRVKRGVPPVRTRCKLDPQPATSTDESSTYFVPGKGIYHKNWPFK